LHSIFPKRVISWVVVLDGRVMELFMTTPTSGCSNPTWNWFRPRSWWWKIQFEVKNQSQK